MTAGLAALGGYLWGGWRMSDRGV